MSELDWFVDGSCRGKDSALWFPLEDSRRASSVPALRVCAGCDVKVECLAYAVANHIEHGVWGQTTPSQRKPMFRGVARQPKTTLQPRYAKPGAKHATRAGYTAGCRCRPCTEANRDYERYQRPLRRRVVV